MAAHQDEQRPSAQLPGLPPLINQSMKTRNPDHNLWNNNGTFWCRFSVHYPDYTAGRIARPLRTRDLAEARLRRDEIMKSTPGAVFPELEFSPSHEPQLTDLAGARRTSSSDRTPRKPRKPISKRHSRVSAIRANSPRPKPRTLTRDSYFRTRSLVRKSSVSSV
jgi:hypothetical protein